MVNIYVYTTNGLTILPYLPLRCDINLICCFLREYFVQDGLLPSVKANRRLRIATQGLVEGSSRCSCAFLSKSRSLFISFRPLGTQFRALVYTHAAFILIVWDLVRHDRYLLLHVSPVLDLIYARIFIDNVHADKVVLMT